VTIHKIVRNIIEDGTPQHLQIGDTIRQPDGRDVCVTNGSFYGDYGRVSNFWTWREVLQDGSLGVEEKGYGTIFGR
jgi:hypothetical protein